MTERTLQSTRLKLMPGAQMTRLFGVLLIVFAMQIHQGRAQDLVLHDTTLTTAATFSANSITAGPGFTVASTGDVVLRANSVAIQPAFSIVQGGKFQVISGASLVNIEAEDQIKPDGFVVHQNYPNPFKPTTTITYAIPEAVHVTLVVYDILGRERACLVDAQQAPGVYHARFDAVELPSGVYLYRLQAGTYRETKTLTLAK